MPFSQYMGMALYDPEYGYYATGAQRVGKAGDFITSVSVGRCFGMILARRLYAHWQELESPDTYHIIEPGAHDGSLGADILAEIAQLDSDFYQAAHYHLIEATPSLVAAQEAKLSPSFTGKFSTHQQLNQLHQLTGALISNELVDAFPVELIRLEEGKWNLLAVGLDDEQQLEFQLQTITDPTLKQFCASLGTTFEPGYTTEYHCGIRNFADDAANALGQGLFITVDYGHATEDYYHPGRTAGCLQTYYQHQKAEAPLTCPGEMDITSHIDFSKLSRDAEEFGFVSPKLKSQASYLTDHARQWLLDIENPATDNGADTAQLLRQFQTLIHPAMLGIKFSVLEMRKST